MVLLRRLGLRLLCRDYQLFFWLRLFCRSWSQACVASYPLMPLSRADKAWDPTTALVQLFGKGSYCVLVLSTEVAEVGHGRVSHLSPHALVSGR